jgi:hypothetical protein
MLKKKRFSGLFGTNSTEIPSPGPEQQAALSFNASGSSVNGTVGQGFSPTMLSSQGRQGSMSALTPTGGIGNFPSLLGGGGISNNSISALSNDDEGQNALTRTEVHQSLENLKKLIIAAESYRELATKLAKTSKQLGKCFKEYGDSKGMDSVYGM